MPTHQLTLTNETPKSCHGRLRGVVVRRVAGRGGRTHHGRGGAAVGIEFYSKRVVAEVAHRSMELKITWALMEFDGGVER